MSELLADGIRTRTSIWPSWLSTQHDLFSDGA